MTQDEIIAMLRASCDKDRVDPEQNGFWVIHTEELEAFAKLVAEHVYAKYLEPPEPKQSGTISIITPVPIGYLCENAVGHKYFRWKKPSSTYKPIALYAKEKNT